MHDPMTVAFEIKSPIKHRSKFWPEGYRNTLVTIWHVDPEMDHTDDSCGWFMRARHGDKAVLERIIKAFEFDWDRQFKSETGKVYYTGYFFPEDAGTGMPNMGVTAIVLNLFFIAANKVFEVDGRTNWKRTRQWMQAHLFDIMLFAENPTDSLRQEVVRFYGTDTQRNDRIKDMAGCIYAWILRANRPWYKHPRWHVWHWKIQIHPLQSLKRWLFSRCAGCGKRFSWGYSPVTYQWHGKGPSWFTSETGVYHEKCLVTQSGIETGTKPDSLQ